MVNVVVFKSPDMFAESGRVPLFYFSVTECCSEVSVSCLEVVFCGSDHS